MSSRVYATDVSFAYTHAPESCRTRTPSITRTLGVRYLERQLVQAWKSVTRATRKKQNRVSVLPGEFVFVTSRRRSTIYYQPPAKSGRF
ncbi:hypothetical protein HGRIS_004892 [Hohenbuehelia grisea]|uniref:Uncharacterized protein n=1 Tax=Hohenbuehelia grisea TaxID=104357 RepID=A0ABR3JE54_9AGAR